MQEVVNSRPATAALSKIASLFAIPLFEMGGAILSGNPEDAKRHTAEFPGDLVGLEAFVNHYHLEDYVGEFHLEPRQQRRVLNRLAETLALVWSERLVKIIGNRTALFYLGGSDSVVVRFHLERTDEVPWADLNPDFLKRSRIRVFRSSLLGLERIA